MTSEIIAISLQIGFDIASMLAAKTHRARISLKISALKNEVPGAQHDAIPEKASLKVRRRLMDMIVATIETKDWSPKQCEAIFGMRQARISELLNRKAEAFSLDKLVDLSALIDREITIEFR